MPRLSVDIDLTYIHIEDRETSLRNINDALARIRDSTLKVMPQASIDLLEAPSKLAISSQTAQIKLEVNQTGRGILGAPNEMTLCKNAQDEFGAFCAMPVVPIGQLFGGKVCAALDRQHPRDLFDVKYLLMNESINDEIKTGTLLSLLGSSRPTNELIRPNLLDQRKAMDNQFTGMAIEPFTYDDFEETRKRLIEALHGSLTDQDRTFLVGFNNLEPDWSIYNFQEFPSIQWKLLNLQNLKSNNPEKHKKQIEDLIQRLG